MFHSTLGSSVIKKQEKKTKKKKKKRCHKPHIRLPRNIWVPSARKSVA